MPTLPIRQDVVPGPAPVVHPENEGFWNALKEGGLRLQQCAGCGTIRFPVAPSCWRCLSFEHSWVDVDADGTVAAATEIVRATGNPVWQDATPYLTGLVDTRAGVRLPGRILCTCGAASRHGTPVTPVRVPTRGEWITYAFQHDCGAEA